MIVLIVPLAPLETPVTTLAAANPIEEFVTHLEKQKKEVSNWVIDIDPINTS